MIEFIIAVIIVAVIIFFSIEKEKVYIKNLDGQVINENAKDSLKYILEKPYGTYIYEIYKRKMYNKEWKLVKEKKVEYTKDTYVIYARNKIMQKGMFIPSKSIVISKKDNKKVEIPNKEVTYADMLEYPFGEYEIKVYLKNPYNNTEFYEDTKKVIHTEVTKKEFLNKDIQGENEFLTLCGSDYFKVVHNVNIKSKNNIDIILLHKTGIYVIEKIDATEIVKCKGNNRFWSVENNNEKTNIYNPLLQNKTHIKEIMKVLELEEERLITSLIVFKDKVILQNKPEDLENLKIINKKELSSTLSNIFSKKIPFLSDVDIDTMYKKLQKYSKI